MDELEEIAFKKRKIASWGLGQCRHELRKRGLLPPLELYKMDEALKRAFGKPPKGGD